MKELVILSGKGGTGKTSLVGSLAALAENKVLVDCDVDAANLHLITQPEIKKKQSFIGGLKAHINEQKCTACGICVDYCRFDAIKSETKNSADKDLRFFIDDLSCEGCGVCTYFCPEEAIKMGEVKSGEWYESQTRFGPMVHGRLGMAEGNSGKLVALLRSRAREIALAENLDLILVDGPPGIGCPAISSLTGADYVMIVTEPTISGYHDLKRVAKLVRYFNIPASICINKYDINSDISSEIETYASEENIDLLGKLNYDVSVIEAQMAGKTLIEYISNETTDRIKSLWARLKKQIKSKFKTLPDRV